MALSNNSADGTVETALRQIGAPQDRVVRLSLGDGITAANFEYADLLKGGELGQRVGAVVEKDGSPLVYLADVPESAPHIGRDLAQLLGNRGETAVLLDVHRVANGHKVVARAWPCTLDADQSHFVDLSNPIDARAVLGDLQEGLWGASDNAYQEQRLRDLLVNSVDKVSIALHEATGITPRSDEHGQEVLGLVGRALFARFLLDRGILAAHTASGLWETLGNDGSAAFDSAAHAAATCQWLDQTFNGEFMPLPAKYGYQTYFAKLVHQSPKALEPLGWILHRTDAGGQLPLWEKLDFSHIPAGTLSEVYEDYAHRKAPRQAKAESVHFTPRHIARMMVRQALNGLSEEIAADAKVLDPAVGAAVFLSLTYRELARRYALRHNGVWPDTKALRNILYGQLRGMDINATALNLAALTLYLTAIELDANPAPPEKLKFEKRLIGTVLLDVGIRNPDQPHASDLGSIRSDLELELDHDFDVVIGNPPWTSLGRKDDTESEETEGGAASSDAFAREVESVASKCIAKRGAVLDAKYAHPDKVPDIAFLWKATEWVKEGTGIISLIVHQRLLIKQSKSWRLTRQALFSCIEVDGILDAGEFANHDGLIWPGIESPFCVLFARNRKPQQDHRAHMVTLAVEPTLKWRRQIRIDPLATMTVAMADFDERPGGWVVRTKGCELDRALLHRWCSRTAVGDVAVSFESSNLRRLPLTTIGACVDKFATGTPKRGFKTGKKNTKLPKWFEDLPLGAKELSARAKERMAGAVRTADIHQEFTRRAFKSSPGIAWYQPPYLLLRQSPGAREELARTILVTPSDDEVPVLYPYAFVGIPLQRDADALLYAKYIAIWINSSVYSYYQTLTSTQFTFGIKVLLNDEMLDAPVMEMQQAIAAKLTDEREIETLFGRLARLDKTLQSDIDAWVYQIMGTDAHEQRLIEDTLSISYPIGESRQSGKAWVGVSRVTQYAEQLKVELQHDADIIDTESLSVVCTSSVLSGWRFLRWKLNAPLAADFSAADRLEEVNDEELVRLVRDKYPQGEVWAVSKDGQFVFGQLALNRLWLPSRACLTAQVMVAWADQCAA